MVNDQATVGEVQDWRVSTRCASSECVEVGKGPDGTVHVRSSRDRQGGTLEFTPSEWVAFCAGVRAGEFD